MPRSSPSRSSLRTAPPKATSDEGAEGRKELFRRRRKSLATHLGARRGGAVRRSELGRRINGVSELLLSRESILMDLHHFLMMFSFISSSTIMFVLQHCLVLMRNYLQMVHLNYLEKTKSTNEQRDRNKGGLPILGIIDFRVTPRSN